MRDLFSFLKQWKMKISMFVRIGILSFITAVLSLSQPEVLRRATMAISGHNMQSLVLTMAFAAVTALMSIFFSFFKEISSRAAINNTERHFGCLLFQKFTSTKMAKIVKKKFGDVSAAIIRSVELFAESCVAYISTVTVACFSLILTFGYMCVVEWRLAVCVLVYNLVIRFLAVFVERKMKQNSKELTNAVKASGNELNKQLRNMIMVRIYSNGDFFRERVCKIENRVRKASWKKFVWSNGYQDHIWAFSKLAEFIIVYGVGAILIHYGLSDTSILMAFVFANDLFTIGINNLASSMDAKADMEAHRDNMEDLLNESEIEDERGLRVSSPAGDIEFQKVSFGYEDRPLLKDVSFKIRSGEHILLKGSNGEGKSTILKLLSGLYRPQSGKILWDGEDISSININDLQKSYGYISQHSHVFDGNVLENLALDEHYRTDKANEVLSRLKLFHIKDVDPQRLSMGEQQRLNIGRVLYKGGCELLLCDEIFSNVDKDNRSTVADALCENFPTATVVMISHEDVPYRIDRVFRVEDGSVMEETEWKSI